MGNIFSVKLRTLQRILEPKKLEKEWELELSSKGAALFPKTIALFTLKICEC